jgi:hypothetical protein
VHKPASTQPSPLPASEAAHAANGKMPERNEAPAKSEEKPEEKTIESLTFTQRMALFG